MSIGGINPALADLTVAARSQGKREEDPDAGLGRDAFLRLLTTQLRHQDPLEPAEGTEFLAELANFSTLESLDQLNANFTSLLLLQQVSQGAALIGKEVGFQAPGSSLEERGLVQGVLVEGGQLQLQVGDRSVPLDRVRRIASPEALSSQLSAFSQTGLSRSG